MVKKNSTLYLLVMLFSTLGCVFLLIISAFAVGPWSLKSPDGSLKVDITQATDGSLSYTVSKGGSTVIEKSALGLKKDAVTDFKTGLTYETSSSISINDPYSMAVGKKSVYLNNCNELTLGFEKNSQQFNLIFRAYNDGIAYRYNLPIFSKIVSEYSQFNLPLGKCWISLEDSVYEKPYLAKSIYNVTGTTDVYSMCPLFQTENEFYIWISEADVCTSKMNPDLIYHNYCSSNLKGSGASDGVFNVVNISSTPASAGTNNSPWRIAAISSSLSTLLETTIVENLSPSNDIGDTSWAPAGGCAWTWLNGDSCSSLEVAKQYIDFAASMGWKYYMADAGWEPSWAPEMCAYGNSKNVGVILWADQEDLSTQEKIDATLTMWAGWGAKGIKVDYFNSEDEYTNKQRVMIIKKAAQLHLNVSFHGTVKPTGQQRTWPNILTWEAVRGNENNPDSVYFNTIPYTRCVAGPADITPVMQDSKNTGCFETATALTVMSNYICYAGKPSLYDTFGTKEFLKILPATYDDTKFIEGNVGSFTTVARKKGNDWFVGGTTVNARTATIPLSFLGQGTYVATIYKDNSSGTGIAYSTQNVTNATTLSIPCLNGGGFVIYISTKALPAPVKNLAAGKAVKASSEWDIDNSASKAIDLSHNTKWKSGYGTSSGEWLQVDFGTSTRFNTVVTKTLEYSGKISGYRIECSNDGISWTKVTEGTDIGKYKADQFAPVTARYVRFFITSSVQTPSISEFEVYNLGTNLASSKTVTASSQWDSNYGPLKITDGKPTTSWMAALGKSGGEYLVIDLGTSMSFNTLVTDENKDNQRIQGYTYEYSNDKINWSTIVNGNNMGTYKIDRIGSVVTARYVRLKITSASGSPNINEILIYNW